MRLISIIRELKKRLKGSLRIAIENGMVVEEGVSVLGGVNFGSEPIPDYATEKMPYYIGCCVCNTRWGYLGI